MFPPWAWVVIAIVVVIIIVVIIVVVTSSSSSTPTPLYRIQNVYAPDKYLDILNNTLIVSSTGMNFSLSLDSTGTSYYVKSADDSSKVLTYTSGAADGSIISLATNTGLTTQSWVIQSTSTDSDIFLNGQTLQFKPLANTAKSMDFLNPDYSVTYQVSIWTESTTLNQQWKLVPV